MILLLMMPATQRPDRQIAAPRQSNDADAAEARARQEAEDERLVSEALSAWDRIDRRKLARSADDQRRPRSALAPWADRRVEPKVPELVDPLRNPYGTRYVQRLVDRIDAGDPLLLYDNPFSPRRRRRRRRR